MMSEEPWEKRLFDNSRFLFSVFRLHNIHGYCLKIMGTENTEAISEQEQRARSSGRHFRHSRSSEEPTRGKRQDPNLQEEGQAGQQAGEQQQQQQQQQTIQFPVVEMSQQQGGIDHDVNDQVSVLTRQLNNQL